jgi:hypothetical protein
MTTSRRRPVRTTVVGVEREPRTSSSSSHSQRARASRTSQAAPI